MVLQVYLLLVAVTIADPADKSCRHEEVNVDRGGGRR
jgi:hypothetical protein